MDRTAEMSSLPLDFDGSLDPAGLPEVTLGNHSLLAAHDQSSHTMSRSNTGRISPIRGRTMKEYDQQISDLKKENFSLKMRIYYMEERMQQRYGDGQDVFKTNIELQVEIENLKRDLMDKQVLVQKAAVAMKTLSENHEQAVETMKNRVLVEHQEEMNHLREQAESATKECEKFKRGVEESSKKIESLKQSLEDALFDLSSANQSKEELMNKVKSTEFDVQTLTAQLKLLEQIRSDQEKERSMLIQRQKDLEIQISDARKETHRKDRDLLNLSNLLQNESHLDTKSILEPEHLKDELDDQKEALQRKENKIHEMEDVLKNKDHVIEKLETALKTLRSEKMVAEKNAEDKATELNNKIQVLGKYKRSVEGLVRSLMEKDKEIKLYQDKFKESQLELEKLRESIRKVELERTEAAAGASEIESTNKRLEAQLSDANAMSENLIKSLGKKEGELAGFQDQLKKAMEALNKSEEALEALQSQLKAERADFENQLREQAFKYQMALENKLDPKYEVDHLRKQVDELQSLIATQSSELLAFSKDKIEIADLKNKLNNRDQELKMMSDKHQRELLALTKELEAFKADNQNTERAFQAPATTMMWDNRQYHETINTHKIYGTNTFTRPDVTGDPLELLQEVRSVIDKLKGELSTLAQQHCTSDLRNSIQEKRAPTQEVGSVQIVCQRMDDLLEKNNQLHLAVLAHLKRDSRQSDSPDSNSCQDGGYNLGSPVREVPKSGHKSECLVSASASSSAIGSCPISPELNHSVGVETYPDVLDKSQQTVLSFYHTDQWAQTSPHRDNHQAGDSPLLLRREEGSSSISSTEKTSKPDYTGNNASLGDDTYVRMEESLEDYHNFRHGISLDDYYFEFCRQDRASAVLKSDSKGRRSLPHSRNSKSHDHHSAHLYPKDSSPQSLGASGNGSHTELASDGDEPDGNGCLEKAGQNTVQVFDQGEAPDKHSGQVDLVGGGDHIVPAELLTTDSHEKYSSFTRGLPNSSVQSERKQKGFRSEIDDLVDSTEDHYLDQRHRRNSWAEELEQYRIVDDQSELHKNQFVEAVLEMSVRELRSLAVKLYGELHESEKFIEHHIPSETSGMSLQAPVTHEIQALQAKLEATESTVRLLSRKNKQYISALEAAGMHTKVMSRSNSESCLNNEPRAGRLSTASLENLSHRCSDQDNGHNERSVDQLHSDSSVSAADHNVDNSSLSTTDHKSNISISRVSGKQPYKDSIEKSRSNDTSCGVRPSINLTIGSSVVTCTEAASVTPSDSCSLLTAASVTSSDSCSPLTVDHLKTNLATFKSDRTALQQNLDSTAPAKPGGTSPDQSTSVEMSVFDQSLFADFNYSSILDLTSLTRRASMISSLEGEGSKNWKNLTADQLKLRLEHLEQVNATLREEIAVFEILQGTTASTQTSLAEDKPKKPDRRLTLTEKELLKEHLLEIRRLRQRLEKLDVSNDPDQLLIFQSHVHQRITHQDTMITMLQSQLTEKEKQWQREMTEIHHKLSREKAVVVEKLEDTISQLQGTILSQKDKIIELDSMLKELKSNLAAETDAKVIKEQDLKRILNEKTTLEEDLIKREREFLDLEKAMFKLEMMKENSESECKKLKTAIEDSERERKQLKKDVEEYKECSSCLKEVIEKREKSLHETIQTAQKLNAVKKELEHKLAERDNHLKSLENEISELRRQLQDSSSSLEEELKKLRKELSTKEQHWISEAADYKAQVEKLNYEKMTLKADLDLERQAFNKRADQLSYEKSTLEEHVNHLKTKVASLSRLDKEVDYLSSALDVKVRSEAELRQQIQALNQDLMDGKKMLEECEGRLKIVGEEKHQMEESLKERHEKVKKREKQLHHLLNQQKKLDLAYVKLKYTLTEREELVQSLQRRMHLCEITLNCSSQEEKEDIMKELLKELLATQRQVEDLLSRLEKNTADSKANKTETVINSCSTSSVITTVSNSIVTSASGKSDIKPEMDADVVSSSDDLKDPCYKPGTFSINPGSSPNRLTSSYAESSLHHSKASDKLPPNFAGRDINGLCAIFKLDIYEKLRKETNECLISLSGLEARLNDRLRSYKSKSVSESVDYSTLRECSLASQNMRVCLDEAARLISTAWITELPPIDSLGHFYDPVLAEQNDYLRHELNVTRSRVDMLNQTVKEQQGKLDTSTERHKSWEASLYKQLTKTTKDLEAAKENIDFSLTGLPAPTRKHQSYRHQSSPQKSPLRKHEDTI